jgi:hypothetical protein
MRENIIPNQESVKLGARRPKMDGPSRTCDSRMKKKSLTPAKCWHFEIRIRRAGKISSRKGELGTCLVFITR